jgi:hypothetical protein
VVTLLYRVTSDTNSIPKPPSPRINIKRPIISSFNIWTYHNIWAEVLFIPLLKFVEPNKFFSTNELMSLKTSLRHLILVRLLNGYLWNPKVKIKGTYQ